LFGQNIGGNLMFEKGAFMDELELLTGGCCATHNVQFDRCEHGHSIFKCLSCHKEFMEAEDTGCGG
jgi:hypothetical protein